MPVNERQRARVEAEIGKFDPNHFPMVLLRGLATGGKDGGPSRYNQDPDYAHHLNCSF
jgi:hypothetical protein